MRLMYVIFIAMVCCLIIACSSISSTSAGPLISKPEFRGRVIDAETKEPIEGAVVVVMYYKSPVISGPAGGSSSIVKVKETLTDAKGEFYFEKYTRMLSPLSEEDSTEWIIYKPGYAYYPGFRSKIYPLNLNLCGPELFFANKFGKKVDIKKDGNIVTVTSGEIELPKMETQKGGLRSSPAVPSGYRSKELPLLYKAIDEDRKRQGLSEMY